MSVTNALNPSVVKTDLDAIFVQEWDYPVGPGIATAETPEIFKQVSVDNAAHIEAVLSGGGGFWQPKGEEQPVPQSSPRVTNKVTYTISTWANSIQISKEFFDDNMHETYANMIRKFSMNARATRDRNAFAIYRGAVTTTLTADGVTLGNNAHPLIDGGTVDNLATGVGSALSSTSLNTAMTALIEQKSQDGVTMGQQPAYMLVPSALYKTALEITGSQLVSDTNTNAINVFSSTYNIRVYHSPYLGAVNGGSDTMWFLLSRNHGVTRYIRQGVTTDLVDYIYSNNNNYVYKGMFREQYGCTDYVGVYVNTGV